MSDELAKRVLQFFDQDYNCAQSVLRAVLEHKDKMFDYAAMISAGFGGGIAYQGETCGAVSGAIMALGILEGKNTVNTRDHKNATYKLVGEFNERFRDKFGTTICRDLTGIDMANEKARNEAIQSGHFRETCPKFVENAVRIILDLFPD